MGRKYWTSGRYSPSTALALGYIIDNGFFFGIIGEETTEMEEIRDK